MTDGDTNEAICWGNDNEGAINVPSGIEFQQLDSGRLHTCGLTRGTNEVTCWGSNSDLQANVPTNLGAKEGISSGDKHTCAWSNEERPICWGERHGQSVPVGLVAPTQVQAMYQHSCALGNGITCWGRNFRGMRNFPESLAENAYDVTGGFEHSCAISADQSEVVCVGRFGQANVPDFSDGDSNDTVIILVSLAVAVGAIGGAIAFGRNRWRQKKREEWQQKLLDE